MPKKKPLKIADKTEAAHLLARIGSLKAQLDAIGDAAAASIREIGIRTDMQRLPLLEEAEAIQKALRKWADANREELLEPGSKTLSLTTGEIVWRDGPEAIAFEEGFDEASIIQLLRLHGFGECIRTGADTLDKDAIKKLWPEICDSPMRGLLLVQREFFRLLPTTLAEPIEMKTKTVNIVDRLDGRPHPKRNAA
jgi:phage host-nuclease inhibitor protein Gam